MNIHEHRAHKQNTIKCNLCDFTAKNEEILEKHHRVAMGHNKKIACKFFNNGTCRYGNFCRFEHKFSNDHIITGRQTDSNNAGRVNTQQCKFYDKCFRFPNCGFMHYEVCKYQEKCIKGDRCSFVHVNGNFLDNTRNQNRGF